ncbi:MAG: hypothetical protein ACYDBX_03530 [Patescibacteria group bacterium]
MSKEENKKLIKLYQEYRQRKILKEEVLTFSRNFMPEMIYRTTKLEGEPVTRRMVSLLFK